MKKVPIVLLAFALVLPAALPADACTNIIVTPGASLDGSAMVSYAADSHWLYGELYSHPGGRWKAGSTVNIVEWDTQKPLGSIAQVPQTWRTVGNMNEKQLIIAETTWGGREELVCPGGIMDYGSLIYITLQRASTAREAIRTIVALATEYGYPSEGETFSIADKTEAWIMDLAGKGPDEKGLLWVARRIPDGYLCAHANQARITRFPLDSPDCLYGPDVIEFARRKGWYEGPDELFSYRDAYNPLDFGGARGCEARVWSAFNRLCDEVFTYEEGGKCVSRPSYDWIDYAMGYDLSGEMPLFVQPRRKLGVKDIADAMRDHYEGTPMDMTRDIGAGGNACPYRWRPMHFEVDGKVYVNERAIATQQTGFWFVAQSRPSLPDAVGALVWFGCDDAATSYLTPIYVATQRIPRCLAPGNGDLLHYSPESQFWMCNRVANACYRMYDRMAPVVRAAADAYENDMIARAVPQQDAQALALISKGGTKRAVKALTAFSCDQAQAQFGRWKRLEELLLVKFIDGNIKAQDADGNFLHSKYSEGIPDQLEFGGYNEVWKRAVAVFAGQTLESK
ncbi:MAG: C69 family dipeptidase [Bacteroidales bacterium]|nr:C69 family dipeptidase [Bacteroidales bacterium]